MLIYTAVPTLFSKAIPASKQVHPPESTLLVPTPLDSLQFSGIKPAIVAPVRSGNTNILTLRPVEVKLGSLLKTLNLKDDVLLLAISPIEAMVSETFNTTKNTKTAGEQAFTAVYQKHPEILDLYILRQNPLFQALHDMGKKAEHSASGFAYCLSTVDSPDWEKGFITAAKKQATTLKKREGKKDLSSKRVKAISHKTLNNLRIKTLAQPIERELTTNNGFNETTWLPDNQVKLKVTIENGKLLISGTVSTTNTEISEEDSGKALASLFKQITKQSIQTVLEQQVVPLGEGNPLKVTLQQLDPFVMPLL
jgi:hypothetical protein